MNGGKKKERAKGGFSSETLSFVSSKRNPQMSLCNKKNATMRFRRLFIKNKKAEDFLLSCGVYTTETRLVMKKKKG